MSIYEEKEVLENAAKSIGERMMLAAVTAPKGKGASNIVQKLIDGDDIKELSFKMKDMAEKYEVASFARDADNILQAECLLLIGTKVQTLGLKKCGLCGFSGCEEKAKYPNVPCSFNTGDLGIAIGSAVSVAMDNRADNRIMYTVGQAVLEYGLLGEEVKVAYGIPISATTKNPFFDRK